MQQRFLATIAQRSIYFLRTNQDFRFQRLTNRWKCRMSPVENKLVPTLVMDGSRDFATMAMNAHTPGAEKPTVDRTLDGPFTEEQQILFEEQESLPIVKELTASPDWHEVLAYGHLSRDAQSRSLTAGTLRGVGKIALRPLKFFNHDKTECIVILHLGRNLCGHDGIIHGGLLATLLDEHLAYVTLPNLPNYTGFTANLSVDYRKPVRSHQWVIVRGKLDRIEGRKAYARAWIESAEDHTLLTEATALYISPRMDKSQ